jgi:hypothetical protein
MAQTSDFRIWVEDIWRENCEERLIWQEARQPLNEYFQRYKWWLKREYRFQTRERK